MLSAHGSILFGNSVEKKSEWTSNFHPTVLAHTIRFFFYRRQTIVPYDFYRSVTDSISELKLAHTIGVFCYRRQIVGLTG